MKAIRKKRLEGSELAKAIGTYTYLRILWKSWKKELPPPHRQIFVIIRLEKGYYALSATVIDPTGVGLVRFDDSIIPDTYLGGKDAKRLIAWGILQKIDAPK